jgi:hypothetical protein
LSAGGRPPLGERALTGRSGSIFAHCSSVSICGLVMSDSFRQTSVPQVPPGRKFISSRF